MNQLVTPFKVFTPDLPDGTAARIVKPLDKEDNGRKNERTEFGFSFIN